MSSTVLISSLLFALLSPQVGVEEVGQQLAELRDRDADYVPPRLSERERLDDALPAAMSAIVGGHTDQLVALSDDFAHAGFEITIVTVEHQAWAVFADLANRGAGAYVFRLGPVEHEVLVQAPHAFHDVNTAEIAYRTFARQSVRGFFTNTTHRYGDQGSRSCDVAHHHDSFFQLFTAAALRTRPNSTVLQVHGFAADDDVELIVSNGTTTPDLSSRRIATTLGDQFGVTPAVFGETSNRLGATTNATGVWMRQQNLGRFVHVELSRRLRRQITSLELPHVGGS